LHPLRLLGPLWGIGGRARGEGAGLGGAEPGRLTLGLLGADARVVSLAEEATQAAPGHPRHRQGVEVIIQASHGFSSDRGALGHVGGRPGREFVGGLPAVLAGHRWDDVLVEVQVVVAAAGDLVVAVLALVDRGEVTTMLTGLPLDVHDRVSFDESDDQGSTGSFTPPVGAPATSQDGPRPMRAHAAANRRTHGRPPRILPPT